MRKRDHTIRSHLDRSGAYRSELRAQVQATDEQIDRDWRLVRYWDALSHDLLHERVPSTRPAPDANGEVGELALDRAGDAWSLDPWPFAADRLTVRARGRLLESTHDDQESMRRALARAPWIELEYELRYAAA